MLALLTLCENINVKLFDEFRKVISTYEFTGAASGHQDCQCAAVQEL